MEAQSETEEQEEKDDSEEKMCRYCFEEDGELISPCKCTGGQKWVHLECLRRWQRSVLVSQPTHPAFYGRDERQDICNVCMSPYNCKPPTRHELMTSFTGPELAALIDEGCIIASHSDFSAELERQLSQLPVALHERTSYPHWVRGAYLIVDVTDGQNRTEKLDLDDEEELMAVRARLMPDLQLEARGRTYVLVSEGSLSGTGESLEERRVALQELSAPATLVLRCVVSAGDCGEDSIIAVNLTRSSFGSWRHRHHSIGQEALVQFTENNGGMRPQVRLFHFLGGPCDPQEIRWCIVPGGGGCGWQVTVDVQEAIRLADALGQQQDPGALSRAPVPPDAQFFEGQQVRLIGLRGRPDLNGARARILRLLPAPDEGAVAARRWLVRVEKTEGSTESDGDCEKAVQTENLVAAEEDDTDTRPRVPVLCFWGDARWSRVQLLGEIARGSWGLCRGTAEDVQLQPSHVWEHCADRLIFAPESAMTERYIGADAQQNTQTLPEQMERQRALHREALRRQLEAQQQREQEVQIARSQAVETNAEPRGRRVLGPLRQASFRKLAILGAVVILGFAVGLRHRFSNRAVGTGY